MAEHQVMSCGTGITAINATSCRAVGYCWWSSRFHCLYLKTETDIQATFTSHQACSPKVHGKLSIEPPLIGQQCAEYRVSKRE
jgi:hypothetical protein